MISANETNSSQIVKAIRENFKDGETFTGPQLSKLCGIDAVQITGFLGKRANRNAVERTGYAKDKRVCLFTLKDSAKFSYFPFKYDRKNTTATPLNVDRVILETADGGHTDFNRVVSLEKSTAQGSASVDSYTLILEQLEVIRKSQFHVGSASTQELKDMFAEIGIELTRRNTKISV